MLINQNFSYGPFLLQADSLKTSLTPQLLIEKLHVSGKAAMHDHTTAVLLVVGCIMVCLILLARCTDVDVIAP